MRIGIKPFLILLAIFGILFSVYGSVQRERRFQRNLRRQQATERLDEAIQLYEKMYGKLPRFKNHTSTIRHLISRKFTPEDAEEIARGLKDVSKTEFLFFWLSDSPARWSKNEPVRFYTFVGGEWVDKDGDGLLELVSSRFLEPAWGKPGPPF